MKTRYLLLWLEAPLQSWGADSKFGRRNTLDFPTKSGIAGLLLCALGAGGKQAELLAELAPLAQTVISYTLSSEGSEESVKAKLRDFHMVGSCYDDSDPWETLHIPKTTEGKKAVGGGVKMTFRYYIQGAHFAAIVEVPTERAGEIVGALQTPAFEIYLGRKCCAPSDLVYRGVYENEGSALDEAAVIATGKRLKEAFRVVDGERSDEVLTLNDVPLKFGEEKRYRERKVSIIRP